WVVFALIIAWYLLIWLFQDHIEARFDARLNDQVAEMVAASESDGQGGVRLTWEPTDPRYALPHSGWYWQISEGSQVIVASRSMWTDRLNLSGALPADKSEALLITGPNKEPLRALGRAIRLPGSENPLSFIVAGPVADIDSDVAEFSGDARLVLTALGMLLLIIIALQISYGLKPLGNLHLALSEIRAGKSRLMRGEFPGEVEPIVRELNALLEHNSGLLERARTQAGNLAHALKNPLLIIQNETTNVQGPRGQLVHQQLKTVNSIIDHQLSKARLAGSTNLIGAQTSVQSVIGDLIYTLEILYQDRNISLTQAGLENLLFRGDRQDLEELLGNLIDNACKWANGTIKIAGESLDYPDSGRLFRLTIEDDGPGIPAAEMLAVLQRGHRLDEQTPGSGIGLNVARDIVKLYSGKLDLDTSSIGGLRVRLILPAA
ncbi:MAG TPA: HAMP domain-containing histidine kinase, partial [Rhodospirillales bacterium]|nr:HAMP domain-containing histidine kinase [Rhodospirillales bacterium]